jgi:3-oxoacyl-[acyl-carrier-protein] synthase III
VATPGEGTMLSEGAYGSMAMNGKEVYKFATREVPKVLTESLEAAGMTVDDIDWLLLHQVRWFVIVLLVTPTVVGFVVPGVRDSPSRDTHTLTL